MITRVALLISTILLGQGMDLPMPPVRLGDPPAVPFAPDDDDGDDPRDTPPPVFYGEEIESESDSIVYVIDTSCSMMVGFTGSPSDPLRTSRLAKAKREVLRSIHGLPASFRFNVVGYSCEYIRWSAKAKPATEENKAAYFRWSGRLWYHGSTGTGPAVAATLSFERDNLSVVLLTDGMPNCGARGLRGHREVIRQANRQGATINVFGILARGQWRAFCQGVASDSGGSYFDVPL